jgi:hypothetical protein
LGRIENMKKVYYEKIGRRYVPVAEYDNDLLDSFPRGAHLVLCYPGGTSRRFNVEPNHAALIAAGRVAEDAICDALRKSSEMKPQRTPITPRQKKAWENLAKELGDELCPLTYGSTRDHAEAAVNAMIAEAEKLLSVPAVKNAYDHFMMLCELTKEQQRD